VFSTGLQVSDPNCRREEGISLCREIALLVLQIMDERLLLQSQAWVTFVTELGIYTKHEALQEGPNMQSILLRG
jgi:hypothetical protein